MIEDPSYGALPEYSRKKKVPVVGLFGEPDTTEEVDDTDSATIPGAVLPSRNPLAKKLAGDQWQKAQDYLKNFRSNSDSLFNSYANDARQSLKEGSRHLRDDFNSRGLLNSGGQVNAESNLRSGLVNALGQRRAKINADQNNTLTQMEGNAFGSAGLMAQPGPDTANPQLSALGSNMGQSIDSMNRDSQLYGGLASGVGSLAGVGLAGLMQNNGQKLDFGSPKTLPASYWGGRNVG